MKFLIQFSCVAIVFISMLLGTTLFAQQDQWRPVQEDTKWRFQSIEGDYLNTASFDSLTRFDKNGFASAMNKGKWGVLNWNGDTIVPLTFDYVNFQWHKAKRRTDEGIMYFFVSNNVNDTIKFGLYSSDGNEILETAYYALYMHHAFVPVPYFYANVKDSTGRYSREVYSAEGKRLFKARHGYYPEIIYSQSNKAFIQYYSINQYNQKTYGLNDVDGNEILAHKYISLNLNSDQYPIVAFGTDYFTAARDITIDNKQYSQYEIFDLNGDLIYEKKRTFGNAERTITYVNKKGDIIGEFSGGTKRVTPTLNDESFIIELNEGSSLVAKNGGVLIPADSSSMVYKPYYKSRFIDLKDKNNKWGVIDIYGKQLIPQILDQSLKMNEVGYWDKTELYRAIIDGRSVLFDTNWTQLDFGEYDDVCEFYFRFQDQFNFEAFFSKKQDKIGLIDRTGKVLIPHNWKNIVTHFTSDRKAYIFQASNENTTTFYASNYEDISTIPYSENAIKPVNDSQFIVRKEGSLSVYDIYDKKYILRGLKRLDKKFIEELYDQNYSPEFTVVSVSPALYSYFSPKKVRFIFDDRGKAVFKTKEDGPSVINPIVTNDSIKGFFYSVWKGDTLNSSPTTKTKYTFFNGTRLDTDSALASIQFFEGKFILAITESYHSQIFTANGELIHTLVGSVYLENKIWVENIWNEKLKQNSYNLYDSNFVQLNEEPFTKITHTETGFYIGKRKDKYYILPSLNKGTEPKAYTTFQDAKQAILSEED